MATTKVSVFRSYYGPVPLDGTGQPLPKDQWPDKRPHSWVARWFGVDGKRYSQSFATRKEAQRFAETKQQEVRKGRGDRPERLTMADFAKEHATLAKGSGARYSLVMALATWRLLAEQVGWKRELTKVTTRDIEMFRARRTQAGKATATVNREIRSLKTMFNHAIQRRYLAAGNNPCVGVKLAKVAETRPPYVSPEQFEPLYAQAGNVWARTAMVIFYVTGVRRNELYHLTWDDVDLDRAILHIARHEGRGYVQPWQPKDHERRELPLPPQAVVHLRQLKAVAPADCPYVFMEQSRWDYYRQQVDAGQWKETCHLVNNTLRKFKTACKRAGLGDKFCIHDLRRSCITNWVRNGLPIHVTQLLAGHADIKTTQRYYLSVQESDLTAARVAQQRMVQGLTNVTPTDQLLTKSGVVGGNLKRKEFSDGTQLPKESGVV